MANREDIDILDLPEASTISGNDISIVVQTVGSDDITRKTTVDLVGNYIAGTANYDSLNTTSKQLVPAVNELASDINTLSSIKQDAISAGTGISISNNTVSLSQTVITGTLTAGNTSIIFTNSAITTNSEIRCWIEPPTNTYDGSIRPLSMTIDDGSVTLNFAAQQSNIGVKVVIT